MEKFLLIWCDKISSVFNFIFSLLFNYLIEHLRNEVIVLGQENFFLTYTSA